MAQKPNAESGGRKRRRGSVIVEYILLLTIVGLGAIVGLASLRNAVVQELADLAAAVEAMGTGEGQITFAPGGSESDPPPNPE